jgi:hypothetical protein
MWAFDSDTKRMVHREIKYVPGFFKIVDEILVNAADNKVRKPLQLACCSDLTVLDQRLVDGLLESQH